MRVITKEERAIKVLKGVGLGLLALSALTIPIVKVLHRKNKRVSISMADNAETIDRRSTLFEEAEIIDCCDLQKKEIVLTENIQ